MKGKTLALLKLNQEFHNLVLGACDQVADEVSGNGVEIYVTHSLQKAEVLVTISTTYFDGPISLGLVEFHSQQGLTLEQMVEALHLAVQKKLS